MFSYGRKNCRSGLLLLLFLSSLFVFIYVCSIIFFLFSSSAVVILTMKRRCCAAALCLPLTTTSLGYVALSVQCRETLSRVRRRPLALKFIAAIRRRHFSYMDVCTKKMFLGAVFIIVLVVILIFFKKMADTWVYIRSRSIYIYIRIYSKTTVKSISQCQLYFLKFAVPLHVDNISMAASTNSRISLCIREKKELISVLSLDISRDVWGRAAKWSEPGKKRGSHPLSL